MPLNDLDGFVTPALREGDPALVLRNDAPSGSQDQSVTVSEPVQTWAAATQLLWNTPPPRCLQVTLRPAVDFAPQPEFRVCTARFLRLRGGGTVTQPAPAPPGVVLYVTLAQDAWPLTSVYPEPNPGGEDPTPDDPDSRPWVALAVDDGRDLLDQPFDAYIASAATLDQGYVPPTRLASSTFWLSFGTGFNHYSGGGQRATDLFRLTVRDRSGAYAAGPAGKDINVTAAGRVEVEASQGGPRARWWVHRLTGDTELGGPTDAKVAGSIRLYGWLLQNRDEPAGSNRFITTRLP